MSPKAGVPEEPHMPSRRPVPSVLLAHPLGGEIRGWRGDVVWWNTGGSGIPSTRLRPVLPAPGCARQHLLLPARGHHPAQQERVQHLLHCWDLHIPTESLHISSRSPWWHGNAEFAPLPPSRPGVTWLCISPSH